MKCPNCGYEQPYTMVNEGQRYRKAVYDRLTEYGYGEQMNPRKYQAYEAIRKAIQIRYGVSCKSGGSMTKEQADRAMEALDDVLPSKGGHHETE